MIETAAQHSYPRIRLAGGPGCLCSFCGREPAEFAAPPGAFPAKNMVLCVECLDEMDRALTLLGSGAQAGDADGGYWRAAG